MERIYDILQDQDKLEQLCERLASSILEEWHPHGIERGEKWIVKKALPHLIRCLISKLDHERAQPDSSQFPSENLLQGLDSYIAGPLQHQMSQDLNDDPGEVTMIFGHTHQPFQRAWDASSLGTSIKLYNTGGWAVNPGPRQTHMGGAAILLDDELNATSLRFFNQSATENDTSSYRVSVETADPDGNALHNHLILLIDNERAPYRSFSTAAAASVNQRFAVMQQVVDGEDTGAQ